jgi:hypothetical protein
MPPRWAPIRSCKHYARRVCGGTDEILAGLAKADGIENPSEANLRSLRKLLWTRVATPTPLPTEMAKKGVRTIFQSGPRSQKRRCGTNNLREYEEAFRADRPRVRVQKAYN